MGSYGGIKWSVQQQEKTGYFAPGSASLLPIFGGEYLQQMRRQRRQYTQWPGQQQRTRLQELQQHRSTQNAGDNVQQVGRRQSQTCGSLLLHRRKEVAEGSVCFSSCVLPVERRGNVPSLILLLLLIWETLAAPCGEGFSAGALALEARHYGHPQVLTSPSERRPKKIKRELLPSIYFAEGEQSFAESLLSSAFASKPALSKFPPYVPPLEAEEIYEFSSPGVRVLALGDVHGDMGNTLLMLSAAGVIDPVTLDWAGGNTVLVQTGDVVDRGDKGAMMLHIFARWAQQAHAVGGQVVRLVGNHEMMNVCGFFQYASPAETAALGGIENRRSLFSFGVGTLGKLVSSMLVAVKIDGIVYSHAGITPTFAKLGLRELTLRFRMEVSNDCTVYLSRVRESEAGASGGPLLVSGPGGPLWTRAFARGTAEEICQLVDETLKELKATRMVMGHNVQPSKRVEAYCGGKLIALDVGLSYWVNNTPGLLEIRNGQITYGWSVTSPPRWQLNTSALRTAPEKAVVYPLITPTTPSSPTPREELPGPSSAWPPPQEGTASRRREETLGRESSTSRSTAYAVREHSGVTSRLAAPARRKSASESEEYRFPPERPVSPSVTTSTSEEREGNEMPPPRPPPPRPPPPRPPPPQLPLPQSRGGPESPARRRRDRSSPSRSEEL